MFEKAKTAVHERLMTRMTATTGADLQGQDHAALMGKCCGCGNVGGCEDWLEDHSEGADRAPGFCANQVVMQRPEG